MPHELNHMGTGRLEAFSDGVIAIIITIMVLEFKVPHDTSISALISLWPTFMCYALSFIYVGIYWNNHHHMLLVAEEINGRILWANLHLLFWLSLIPFTTAWMGENHFVALPTALYGVVLFMAATAYYILAKLLIAHHSSHSTIALALRKTTKEILSLICYAAAIPVAFYLPWASMLLYGLVASLWLIPDKRIEKRITNDQK